MIINLEVIGKKSHPLVRKYTWQDCALYALGIGAGENNIEFVYEGAPGGMKVYPTFGVLPIMPLLFKFIAEAEIDLASVLHAGHRITLHKAIPPQGCFHTSTLCKSIYDKGKAALVNVEFETRDDRGEVLFTNEMSIFCRGQGNFGGDPGPKPLKFDPPAGVRPLFIASYPIPERQAAIYRLSGDYNPLHIDPEAAAKAGFQRPVLHGLCTYGYTARAVLEQLCRGEVARFKEFSARFSSIVFPGDVLTVKGWAADTPNLYIIIAETQNGVVLDQSYVSIRP